MSDVPEIYTALAAVMADVQAVAKTDRNDHAKYNFRGVDAVMNAVGPALRTHQVIVTPSVRSVVYADVTTSGGKASTACRVEVAYTFHATDGSHIETSVAGEAWDSGDKACPKAMSVAFRTALLQSLCLPTDDPDPDSHTYERDEPPSPSRQQPRTQKAADPPPDLPPLDELLAELADTIANAQQAGVKPTETTFDELYAWASENQTRANAAIAKVKEAIANYVDEQPEPDVPAEAPADAPDEAEQPPLTGDTDE
jgi:hypothetical protein